MGYSRLSLSMDDSVVAKARWLSDQRGVSISKMFVSFILETAEEAERDKEEVLPPVAAQLKGILKPETPISEEWDYRNILDDTRMERFGV